MAVSATRSVTHQYLGSSATLSRINSEGNAANSSRLVVPVSTAINPRPARKCSFGVHDAVSDVNCFRRAGPQAGSAPIPELRARAFAALRRCRRRSPQSNRSNRCALEFLRCGRAVFVDAIARRRPAARRMCIAGAVAIVESGEPNDHFSGMLKEQTAVFLLQQRDRFSQSAA